MLIHPDRLFPADPATRDVARRLYAAVKDLPIVSPHGHTDPRWFAENRPFADPAQLLVIPDHYVLRMLYSQGLTLEELGVMPKAGGRPADPRAVWRRFAANYHLFRGTPSRLWLDHTFATLFGLEVRLTAATADDYYDHIADCLAREDYLPRALFDRFGIEVIATTESPLDDLRHHRAIRDSGWPGRVVTAYRPDPVVDPDYEGFAANLRAFGDLTDCDVATFAGYIEAHRRRRLYFKAFGATSTDHGHPTAQTADLDPASCEALYQRIRHGGAGAEDAELFRAQMLTEMAGLSREDGLVMQIHPGAFRNHNAAIFRDFGRDLGADIPQATDYVRSLKPLLDRHGNDRDLTIILFTLDETAYARELAPLAGHYPALRLGPAWWFFDSPDGMRRYREAVTETAGFYNTVGFNDDTRAFPSIPARHDVARRIDCRHLADLVATHRLDEDEAHEVAHDLAYRLAKQAYKL